MLGSGDTFRAAAYEQLGEWGRRAGAEMGPYKEGDKPRKVLARAVREAKAQGSDVLLCDTSGRLHTNWQLMDELQGVEKEISKTQPGAPHEVLLVLDGSTGLNMMNQVRRSMNASSVALNL
jgi:fused signal recognition particle receptor